MLHLETVEPNTFSVLNRLMDNSGLQDFHLVGGTALSLIYGHRLSIDLDLFSTVKFDNNNIETLLQEEFHSSLNIRTSSHFGLFGFIDSVKVDIVRYPHPFIRPVVTKQGIRMFSLEDLIAMKVQAVLGRGKKKDFWDIAELLQHFSVEEFIQFHKEKYSTQHLFITVPQAITYFADADESEDPISLKGQTWEGVKDFIKEKVEDFLK